MANQNEIWKDIPGYEGSYQASSMGRIKSLERYIWQRMNGGGIHRRLVKERILHQYITADYLFVRLYKEGEADNYYVHVLIADAFIPNPNNLPVINHEDGNKLNNQLSNLNRTTRSENQLHAYRMGLQVSKIGEDHYLSKLKNADVIDIRNLVNEGVQQKLLAEKYNVSRALINIIVKGKHRKYA